MKIISDQKSVLCSLGLFTI